MRLMLVLALSALTRSASAQVSTPESLHVGGYVESFWQWNFARPSNGITNFRAFDNRHDTFTLSNVALDVGWDDGHVIARVVGQVGHTPSTYYASEPTSPGSNGANGSDASTWKYLQQAYLGYRFELLGRTATVDLGLFLSPIGPESMAVHDNATFSRSVLFYGLPFYHTGARASYEVSPAWTLMLAAFNGWNSVVDNNTRKSLALQAVYAPAPEFALNLLYFGGVERARNAAEGQPWRNLFDAHARWTPHSLLSLLAHANAGFEANAFGTSWWSGGALTVRSDPWRTWSFAVRGDLLAERPARNAALLFYPAARVGSATATVQFRPATQIAFMLEYRHDQASGPIYFRGGVPENSSGNTSHGDTVTVGATAWL